MTNPNPDFYQQLRTEIRDWLETKTGRSSKWSEYLLVAPDLFHLLCKLAMDKNVPGSEKAKLAGAIAYFVSPIDLIPEGFIGAIGYIDDVALAAWVLHSIMEKIGPEIILSHWAGDADVLDLIKRIVEVANDMVGEGLFQKLKDLVK
jgi:uncharacterized membrane protein YkvA (DUF1232 family)